MDIVVIADTQVSKDVPIDHLYALGRYIWQHKPETIVHIGDHWDFPSLSTHSSAKDSEGKRLKDDLDAGVDALRAIMAHTDTRNTKGKLKKESRYEPDRYFLMGNHENRLNRFVGHHPALDGIVDLKAMVEDEGWKFYGFCNPLFINDVAFNHYIENPMSGRPLGGSMESKLNKIPHSFCHGHQQQYQYARRQNLLGRPHFGVCAGSFYMHDEDYRGSNNTEIRGFTHFRHFINRYGYDDYDVEFVSLERLLQEHGE